MHKEQHTYEELMLRLHSDGALEYHRSLVKARSQFDYWQKRLGDYALVHISPELIGKERQLLMDNPTRKGEKRSAGTINRYMAVLSSTFNYAVKRLRWLNDNPCSNLLKIKDNARRDRVLQEDEFTRLLEACRESKSEYLYCIVLIALTTGARQGEILNLEWSDINWEKQQAYFKETKNGRPRTVPLVDSVIEELKKINATRQLNKSFVFASRIAFRKIDIKKGWREALKRAEIDSLTFHGL